MFIFLKVACCFIYHGLSQSSIQIPNTNRYISFIISMAIEIPCALLSQPLLNKMKRRTLLGGSFILVPISMIATAFIPETYSAVILLCSLVGKASITIAFIVIYLYTCEQWPTNVRNTITNTCSMIGRLYKSSYPIIIIIYFISIIFLILGRIGAIASPFAVLLV